MPGTVTVACKIPNGMMLQLQEPYKLKEYVRGEVVENDYFRFVGKSVRINGPAFKTQKGPRVPFVGDEYSGIALTHGVDKDFFDKWIAQNRDLPAVASGFIFAGEKPNEVEAKAKDRTTILCGLEPLNPSKLPPEFTRKGAKVETMERA